MGGRRPRSRTGSDSGRSSGSSRQMVIEMKTTITTHGAHNGVVVHSGIAGRDSNGTNKFIPARFPQLEDFDVPTTSTGYEAPLSRAPSLPPLTIAPFNSSQESLSGTSKPAANTSRTYSPLRSQEAPRPALMRDEFVDVPIRPYRPISPVYSFSGRDSPPDEFIQPSTVTLNVFNPKTEEVKEVGTTRLRRSDVGVCDALIDDRVMQTTTYEVFRTSLDPSVKHVALPPGPGFDENPTLIRLHGPEYEKTSNTRFETMINDRPLSQPTMNTKAVQWIDERSNSRTDSRLHEHRPYSEAVSTSARPSSVLSGQRYLAPTATNFDSRSLYTPSPAMAQLTSSHNDLREATMLPTNDYVNRPTTSTSNTGYGAPAVHSPLSGVYGTPLGQTPELQSHRSRNFTKEHDRDSSSSSERDSSAKEEKLRRRDYTRHHRERGYHRDDRELEDDRDYKGRREHREKRDDRDSERDNRNTREGREQRYREDDRDSRDSKDDRENDRDERHRRRDGRYRGEDGDERYEKRRDHRRGARRRRNEREGRTSTRNAHEHRHRRSASEAPGYSALAARNVTFPEETPVPVARAPSRGRSMSPSRDPNLLPWEDDNQLNRVGSQEVFRLYETRDAFHNVVGHFDDSRAEREDLLVSPLVESDDSLISALSNKADGVRSDLLEETYKEPNIGPQKTKFTKSPLSRLAPMASVESFYSEFENSVSRPKTATKTQEEIYTEIDIYEEEHIYEDLDGLRTPGLPISPIPPPPLPPRQPRMGTRSTINSAVYENNITIDTMKNSTNAPPLLPRKSESTGSPQTMNTSNYNVDVNPLLPRKADVVKSANSPYSPQSMSTSSPSTIYSTTSADTVSLPYSNEGMRKDKPKIESSVDTDRSDELTRSPMETPVEWTIYKTRNLQSSEDGRFTASTSDWDYEGESPRYYEVPRISRTSGEFTEIQPHLEDEEDEILKVGQIEKKEEREDQEEDDDHPDIDRLRQESEQNPPSPGTIRKSHPDGLMFPRITSFVDVLPQLDEVSERTSSEFGSRIGSRTPSILDESSSTIFLELDVNVNDVSKEARVRQRREAGMDVNVSSLEHRLVISNWQSLLSEDDDNSSQSDVTDDDKTMGNPSDSDG